MFSRTIAGLLVILLGTALNRLGVPVAEAELEPVVAQLLSGVSLLMQVGGAAWSWYARYTRGDIAVTGVRLEAPHVQP